MAAAVSKAASGLGGAGFSDLCVQAGELREELARGVENVGVIAFLGVRVDHTFEVNQYFLAHAGLGVPKEGLAGVVLNACESAFLPEYEKVALVARVQSELEALP